MTVRASGKLAQLLVVASRNPRMASAPPPWRRRRGLGSARRLRLARDCSTRHAIRCVALISVASAPQSGGEARGDPDFRRQRPVDRTSVRDLQQALALRLVERTVQDDLALDGIERPASLAKTRS